VFGKESPSSRAKKKKKKQSSLSSKDGCNCILGIQILQAAKIVEPLKKI
jgi:hypothetical protein